MSSSGQNLPGADAPLGIIGGTGLETFPEIKPLRTIRPETPYGNPSDDLTIGILAGREVVFLPRHGARHTLPPSRIPYKANLAAMKELGVTTVVATCIVGSLKREIEPGFFVVPDQFMNFTWGRDADGVEPDGSFLHLPMGDPYCQPLRQQVSEVLRGAGVTVQEEGTVVVIQGPRFSTRAESRFFSRNGWDIVNMTQYPECVFARELGLCYAAMAAVTDWDVGIDSAFSMHPDTMDAVMNVFRGNTEKTRQTVASLAERLAGFACGCARTRYVEYYKREAGEP
ncbi:MAG: Purine nucleoside phosphorylase [Candidatus Uhrbacteria bacterium GW2011_GWA2_53_10]|uniref:S-methyl-5'-thioadenosine phosphorylase n=1 Tax=Candidatus Uhrbacteria bacterium GW2011_GWA2_53_10 TaxID=1618980 RepID=A0A0G1XLS2_9BACT|nr:MAG: Purine nucleoside phosphorylase [Candidatus Uhrbacteria bacterium GW2011_GWA2_53_10]